MPATRTDARSLELADGRRLAYYEFGDPAGTPAFYVPGTPTSGLAGALHDAAARTAGVRWISLDKPGYGGSTLQRGRRLTDLASDVDALADHLGVERFVVVGESGGGPQALAVAAALPQRATRVVVLSGLGPNDRTTRKRMKPGNRVLLRLAAHAPWLLGLSLAQTARQLRDPAKAAAFAAKHEASMPTDDKALLHLYPQLLEVGLAAAAEALRDGTAGAVDELRMLVRPWDFSLKDVRQPTHIWHGTADRNVPDWAAQRTAAELPDAELHLVEGAGHSVGLLRVDEVMACVAAAR